MSESQKLKKLCYKIDGMTCASCEVLIERKFKKIKGVEKVSVNQASGRAEIIVSQAPSLKALQESVKKDGYHVSLWNETTSANTGSQARNTANDYTEIGAIVLLVGILYFVFKDLNVLPNLGISDNMSYGFVFLIGLVAATSTCIAVTGGLLLAVAAKYNEAHPQLSAVQKFKPTLYFNAGRVISYTLLGGLVGALGSVLTLSTKMTGILSVLVSIVMVLLGFQLLRIFPQLRRFQPKMPKFIAHRVHNISNSDHPAASLLLGAGTFFLPCGFTQALQLYVLSKGDFGTGALTMFFFALGTLPALMSLSLISSFAKGSFQKHFLKFAGVVVVLLGLFNIQNGLALAGINIDFGTSSSIPTVQAGQDPNVKLVNGVQVVKMKVDRYTYTPNRFTVAQGVPVRWEIDGKNAEGCGQVIVMPKLGRVEYMPKNKIKVVEFTPQDVGEISFNCSMGMMSKNSAFMVVPNPLGTTSGGTQNNAKNAYNGPVQKLSIEISRERGFYPSMLAVKKDIPVELEIDTKVPMGGCMSTMVIPEFNVAHLLTLGKTKLRFTPDKAGTFQATCSMGSPMITLKVAES